MINIIAPTWQSQRNYEHFRRGAFTGPFRPVVLRLPLDVTVSFLSEKAGPAFRPDHWPSRPRAEGLTAVPRAPGPGRSPQGTRGPLRVFRQFCVIEEVAAPRPRPEHP